MNHLEKCADALDMAQQLQEQMNEDALAVARLKGRPQSDPDFDGEHCLDCDVDMPPERLAAGRIRCTDCQSAVEKQNKMRGR